MKSPDVVPLVGFIDQVPEIEGAKLSILVLGEEEDAGFVFPAASTATGTVPEKDKEEEYQVPKFLRDTLIVIIGILCAPITLTYELIRYLCNKLK